MSENLKRSNPDFSKYDSMSIGELEEILRADAQGPERDDSDVDEILFVMEVLAKKRRQNGIAGKTALEAYQEFQQHYLPMVEEESKPRRKSNVIPFRRIAAVAASLVLVFSLSITANAFSFKDVWDAVVTWAQETFCFSMGAEVSEPKAEDELKYLSLHDALQKDHHQISLPTWFPDQYVETDVIVSITPLQESYIGIYTYNDLTLKISVKSYLGIEPEQIEHSSELVETYTVNDVEYYIFSNYQQNRAVWLTGSYECYISGELSISELKTMIDSIEKGNLCYEEAS